MEIAKKTKIKPNSEFYWGALAMKAAMISAYDAHMQNVELGFPPELVLIKLREHLELITADMVAAEANQNIGEKTG